MSRYARPTNTPKVSKRGGSTGRGKSHGPAPWAAERKALTEIADRIRAREDAEAAAKIAEAVEIANARLRQTMDPAEVARLDRR